MDLNELADDVIAGRPVTPEEALAVLRLPDAGGCDATTLAPR